MAVSRLHRASLYCYGPSDCEKTINEWKEKIMNLVRDGSGVLVRSILF